MHVICSTVCVSNHFCNNKRWRQKPWWSWQRRLHQIFGLTPKKNSQKKEKVFSLLFFWAVCDFTIRSERGGRKVNAYSNSLLVVASFRQTTKKLINIFIFECFWGNYVYYYIFICHNFFSLALSLFRCELKTVLWFVKRSSIRNLTRAISVSFSIFSLIQ